MFGFSKLMKLTSLTRNMKKKLSTSTIPDDLLEMMHGRKNKERRDSVTTQILLERSIHQERLSKLPTDPAIIKYLDDHGLGNKKKNTSIYKKVPFSNSSTNIDKKRTTGAGIIKLYTFQIIYK